MGIIFCGHRSNAFLVEAKAYRAAGSAVARRASIQRNRQRSPGDEPETVEGLPVLLDAARYILCPGKGSGALPVLHECHHLLRPLE
jgi:hypothetical protein